MHIVITGANRGIGLALCSHFQAAGADVTGVCRKSSAALTELGVSVVDGIDQLNPECGTQLANHLANKAVDVLIANSGMLSSQSLEHMDYEGITEQFAVNAVGPLRIIVPLLPLMRSGGKISLITSRMGSIADNTSGGSYGYRMSKAALNAAGVSLARDLKERGIAVAILHPGHVRTEMTSGHGLLDAASSAAKLAARIEGLDLASSGTFWHCDGTQLPW